MWVNMSINCSRSGHALTHWVGMRVPPCDETNWMGVGIYGCRGSEWEQGKVEKLSMLKVTGIAMDDLQESSVVVMVVGSPQAYYAINCSHARFDVIVCVVIRV